MNRFIGRLALFASLISLWTPLVAAQEHPPDNITRQGASAPFFVSAAAATNSDGSIRWAAFNQSAQLILHMKIANRSQSARAEAESSTAEGCNESILTFFHVGGDVNSLDALVASAPAIYRARVVSMSQGFDEMSGPTTVLATEIVRPIRTEPGFPKAGIVYVLYPKADFRIGGVHFCNAGPNANYSPKEGDELLIFAYDRPVDTTGLFLLTRPQQLIFQRDGKLFAARPLTSDSTLLHTSTLRQLELTVTNSTRERKAQ
jgi:hypothetical protein